MRDFAPRRNWLQLCVIVLLWKSFYYYNIYNITSTTIVVLPLQQRISTLEYKCYLPEYICNECYWMINECEMTVRCAVGVLGMPPTSLATKQNLILSSDPSPPDLQMPWSWTWIHTQPAERSRQGRPIHLSLISPPTTSLVYSAGISSAERIRTNFKSLVIATTWFQISWTTHQLGTLQWKILPSLSHFSWRRALALCANHL